MNTKFAINNIAEAINEIILPKFASYLEDKKNDPSIQAKIANRVKELEAIEDVVSEIESHVPFKSGDSITIDGINFYYSTEREEMTIGSNLIDHATNYILYDEGINDTWTSRRALKIRILAIVSGLSPSTFEDSLKVVEDQINFEEFRNLPN